MIRDPWAVLPPAASTTELSARRVSLDGRWGFFWAIDKSRQPLLVFDCPVPLPPSGVKWPTLAGLEVQSLRPAAPNPERILLRLRNPSLRDTFKELCDVLIHATELHETGADALRAFEQALWRWHSLLRGGRASLSLREQAGLWAELRYLSELGGLRGLAAAVDAWQGPFRSTHDFSFGAADVEIKAIVGDDADASIRISSEFQLADDGARALFLRIYRLGLDEESDPAACSVSELADAIGAQMPDAEVRAHFERRLSLAGLSSPPQTAYRFLSAPMPVDIAVRGDVPRVTAATVPAGVGQVTYALSLRALLPFAGATVEMATLRLAGEATT